MIFTESRNGLFRVFFFFLEKANTSVYEYFFFLLEIITNVIRFTGLKRVCFLKKQYIYFFSCKGRDDTLHYIFYIAHHVITLVILKVTHSVIT